jgi:hypothetical protein
LKKEFLQISNETAFINGFPEKFQVMFVHQDEQITHEYKLDTFEPVNVVYTIDDSRISKIDLAVKLFQFLAEINNGTLITKSINFL